MDPYQHARTPAGRRLRDYEELEATLLPTASPVDPSAPFEDELLLPTAHAIPNRQPVAEAPILPPPPSDERYRNEGQYGLAWAQQQGRREAQQERVNVMRLNRNSKAYNNQAALDVDRANEVARMENYRERRLVNPPIVTQSLTTPLPPQTKAEEEEETEPYFPTTTRGGYQVKEYDLGEYDEGGYSYDVSEYKSDYD
jgi:hypothetical protein